MLQPSRTIQRIALKEITLFFASPVAYVFLATFAAVTLFVFFWGEAFFARNIADVRPLFDDVAVHVDELRANAVLHGGIQGVPVETFLRFVERCAGGIDGEHTGFLGGALCPSL